MHSWGIAGSSVVVLACVACASSHATDDLKPKAGGYSELSSASMNDDDGGAPSTAVGALDGADYLEDADSVLKELRIAFVACDSPRLAKTFVPGSETLVLDVGPDGKVNAVTPESRSGLNDDIENCLRRVAMGAEFAPLAGGKTAKLKVPLMFTRTPLKRVR